MLSASYGKLSATETLSQKMVRPMCTIGQAMIADCPQLLVPAETITSFSVDIVTTPGTEDINLNITPGIDTNNKLVVFSTGPVNPGAKPSFNKATIITVLDHSFVSGGSIKSAYINVFGTMPATGVKAGFMAKTVTVAQGIDGPAFVCQAIGTV